MKSAYIGLVNGRPDWERIVDAYCAGAQGIPVLSLYKTKREVKKRYQHFARVELKLIVGMPDSSRSNPAAPPGRKT